MSTAAAQPELDPRLAVVEQLRQRVAAMERRPAAEPVPTLACLDEVLPMQAGSSYAVDSASLALALAAGASRAGEWVGFAGWTDFGNTRRPDWTCHRRITCAGVAPTRRAMSTTTGSARTTPPHIRGLHASTRMPRSAQ